MSDPVRNRDEVPPDELTPSEALREIAIIFRDIVVGLLAILAGIAIHGWLHLPAWLVPLQMAPFVGWIYWRRKFIAK